MCNFQVDIPHVAARFGIDFAEYFARELQELAADPVADGFVDLSSSRIAVTPAGRIFVRNVAMVFDRYLRARTSDAPVFSRTI